MARILKLNPPYNGMSVIVNVLGRASRIVLTMSKWCSVCSNWPPAEEALQQSLGIPQPTGRFDAVTGFWIYFTHGFFKGQTVDGVVSPARGAHYARGGGIWTIVLFNEFAKRYSAAECATFPAQSAT